MDSTTLAILVMLNNWFHDFAVALLFACLLVLGAIYRRIRDQDDPSWHRFARYFTSLFNKVIVGCWVVIILAGIVRTLAYERFEWSEAAGKGQVAVLVLKHVILVTLVVSGTFMQLRLRKFLRQPKS